MTLHGGAVTIRSRLGLGTSVAVRLPLDCEKARLGCFASNVERLPLPNSAPADISMANDTRVRKRA